MNLSRQQVMISNGYIGIEGDSSCPITSALVRNRYLLTVISNMNYYGYMPSQEALEVLNAMDVPSLSSWWKDAEVAFKRVTADDRKMDGFVVYQNFPDEVLGMSEGEYWFKQIFMYFGFDKELFREEKVERAPLFEEKALKVLHRSDERTLQGIYNSLLANKSRWTAPQLEQVTFLINDLGIRSFTTGGASFRENDIQVINFLMNLGEEINVSIEDATDVLRLTALRSDMDISLRQKVKFKKFPRKERRMLCSMLENTRNLESDVAERPGLWKLLFRHLHPGDFKVARLRKAYDELYNGRLRSYASKVENAILNQDREVFQLLMARPGDFVRRFHHLYNLFGMQAAGALTEAMPRLTTNQLLKLDGYLRTVNGRKQLVYPPRGNWNKLQVVENKKTPIDQEAIEYLQDRIHNVVRERLVSLSPEGFDVHPEMNLVKLQTNDQELASYGRGTVFQIPEEMTFLRTASYWENKGGVTWFDNGWNFFDENWNGKGVVCWTDVKYGDASVFSGDPVNSKEMRGRACQMIDLYIDRLIKKGVRYAVWNILCYSHVPFSQASGEVLATLQWGEKPESGKLYEPSRAQMIFPLQGDNKTKYIAYIDLVERKLVYMDANLRGRVCSARENHDQLVEQMPAFVEYLDTLPSVADLLGHAEGTIPVMYTDMDRELADGQPAYVFNPVNETNSFTQLDLAKFL